MYKRDSKLYLNVVEVSFIQWREQVTRARRIAVRTCHWSLLMLLASFPPPYWIFQDVLKSSLWWKWKISCHLIDFLIKFLTIRRKVFRSTFQRRMRLSKHVQKINIKEEKTFAIKINSQPTAQPSFHGQQR